MSFATGVSAQSAGSWMVRAGLNVIEPKVSSGVFSSPSPADARIGIESGWQWAGGVTYMATDHWSIDVPLGVPFKHKIVGAGAWAAHGELAEAKVLPAEVFLQYRFQEPGAKVRPYVGLGLTYVHVFGERATPALTLATNPGGPQTKIRVESMFAPTAQIGATIALDQRWFVDVFMAKTFATAKVTLSTGQSMDARINPISYGMTLGYKF